VPHEMLLHLVTGCQQPALSPCYDMPVQFRLAEILEATGMSQRELARESGVSLTIISRIVNNHAKQVALSTLERLADALSVQPGDLIVKRRTRRK